MPLELPCCNILWESVGGYHVFLACEGVMRLGPLEYVCDSCFARCGNQVHPTLCVLSTETPA